MTHGPHYPSWRYHATEPARIIQSAAEEADGWADTPVEAELASAARCLEPVGPPPPTGSAPPPAPRSRRIRGGP